MSFGSINAIVGQIVKRFSFFGNKDMSSSYVEVRESENGTGGDFLQLELSDIMNESNGIDGEARFDSEMPKDHTYNKDPGSDEEHEEIASESKGNESFSRKSGRAQRNIKHKFIKPRADEEAGAKKGSPKKSRPKAIVEPLGKKTGRERNKSPVKNEEIAEVNDKNSADEPELNTKRNRKRKIDNDFISVLNKGDEIKQQGKKKAKSNPVKETDVPELKDNDVKRKSPVKAAKVGKTKAEKTSEPKTPKVESAKLKPKAGKAGDGSGSPDLPAGWTRKVVERKSGKSAGMFDIYVYSPEGMKFRSRPDIAAYLMKTKSKLSVENFSFKRSASASTEVSIAASPKTSKPTKDKTSSPKKKPASQSAQKSGKKLKVKISTPKKHDPRAKEASKEKYPFIDCKPSTSGFQPKRTAPNRKRRLT